ncbi:MAG TPA: hypothetical protein EYG17_00015 [Acidimicrobiia bacterium]|nr:hypothetical protein [Acidimicrobiia bacterium]HIL04417.1 hypothetical protein [Acidimicrobiia bacterium]
MNNFRWLNPTQPQTLHSAVILAYFRGFSIVFLGSVYYRQLAYDILGRFAMRISPLVLLVVLVGGGLGIANEKKWGFRLAVSAAFYCVVATLWIGIRYDFELLGFLLRLMFDLVLVVLLLHPQSKEYRRIWFS